ncbi:alpha/beta hydrolase fold domain-containing protein (plasmid) [Rathayibacter sp. VKM Ac-2803]|uniref:alpha/beta hydrolase n=1 Tax=Rathayibacter TaxID=33886 RepID=UPI00135B2F6C|nr:MULTISPECIES: alpha/beta hydrolase [Rathayibacter]MWV51353.1 alpha/beta hydrolase fold domain-containing protein [Rathayibacter sp. VKM Ac-2803]
MTRLIAKIARKNESRDRQKLLDIHATGAGVTTTRHELDGIDLVEFTPPGVSAASEAYVVNIHGGAFMLGDADDAYPAMMSVLLRLPVVSIQYSLSPESVYPVALNECVAAIQSLISTRGQRYVLLGDSAGGNLALAVTLRLGAAGSTLPAALGLSTPWTDLTGMGDSYVANEGRDPLIRWKGQLDKLAARYRGKAQAQDPLISPIYNAFTSSFPPCVIVTGTRDPFLSNCVRLAAALETAGAQSILMVGEGMWHDFIITPDVPESARAREQLAGRLLQLLEPRP